jgi:cytochrome P450
LKRLEPLIRERVIAILESLPVGETFNWVDRVSVELTTGMLATMFDFPWEERHKLTYWSDVATMGPEQLAKIGKTEGDRRDDLMECLAFFTALWKQRENLPHQGELDFISALANTEATKRLSPLEYLGTLILLIVGGNDTTRNSISGGVLALNENPAEYEKLRKDPGLIPNMANEIIRWQTPLAYMRRTATRDTELGGKSIKQGDKVLLWYVSANRDETAIPRANEFLIDREDSKHHLSFGWGVHFCMGSRLAEMQLTVLWEEIVKRFRFVEVVGEPVRIRSSFVKGFAELPVRVHIQRVRDVASSSVERSGGAGRLRSVFRSFCGSGCSPPVGIQFASFSVDARRFDRTGRCSGELPVRATVWTRQRLPALGDTQPPHARHRCADFRRRTVAKGSRRHRLRCDQASDAVGAAPDPPLSPEAHVGPR